VTIDDLFLFTAAITTENRNKPTAGRRRGALSSPPRASALTSRGKIAAAFGGRVPQAAVAVADVVGGHNAWNAPDDALTQPARGMSR
jgi:hypothetical protein